jgi:hypothetical protein
MVACIADFTTDFAMEIHPRNDHLENSHFEVGMNLGGTRQQHDRVGISPNDWLA